LPPLNPGTIRQRHHRGLIQFTPRVVREQVIDFQNQYDLSDAEIRWLKRAGHLRITRTEFKVDASRLMPIYG
jgi:hypothetical protein